MLSEALRSAVRYLLFLEGPPVAPPVRDGVPLFAFSSPPWARSFVTPPWGEAPLSYSLAQEADGYVLLEDGSRITLENGVVPRRRFWTSAWARQGSTPAWARAFVTPPWTRRGL